ncbi:type II toxin-antitoxin system RelE/ParE family toxin [Sphaerospermopsis aphanizomenoides BCCUSP55]|uniref:type II toxin-antitoxin system RelE/ParE family toxin n=1 Tax=Sphaerospermopsis aphanizomenoides TaxID=459663 RepID=UPI001904D0D5|nr:type II toxin-antitoxin system RelE/ParE family toxin [Sphaerospermopsis aphanizomenoides]MBK1986928.1 type II toxin-antitoxin system RelE/ParE family toxin [Sphaerospermopsis aphanizomenoides BCCUSP55]
MKQVDNQTNSNYSNHPASSVSRSRKSKKRSSGSRYKFVYSSQQTETAAKSLDFCLEGIPFKLSKDLELLYKSKKEARRYPKAVVRAFFKVLRMISGNSSDQKSPSFKNLKFHKLERNCKQEYALWLTANQRLITQFKTIGGVKYLVIIKIEDYH